MKKVYLAAGLTLGLAGLFLYANHRFPRLFREDKAPVSSNSFVEPSLEGIILDSSDAPSSLASLSPFEQTVHEERVPVASTSPLSEFVPQAWDYANGKKIGELGKLLLEATKDKDIDWHHPTITNGYEYFHLNRGNKEIIIHPTLYSNGERQWTFWVQPRPSSPDALFYEGNELSVKVDKKGDVTSVVSRPQIKYDFSHPGVQAYADSGKSLGDVVTLTKNNNVFTATTSSLVLTFGASGPDLSTYNPQPYPFHPYLPNAFQDLMTNVQKGYESAKKN